MNLATDAAHPAKPKPSSTVAVEPSPPDGPSRRALPWMLWPLLGVAGLLFLRRPDVFARPQFWAEDGDILFYGARVYGWHSLLTPHPSYYVVAQRLVACAAKDLPALYVPWIYCYAALTYTLLAAWFCLRARLDHLVDRRGRVALALALVLTPQSGEILMTLINSQWTLLPILFILVIQEPPARPAQALADFLGLLLAGMTGPFVALMAPFFLVRLRRITGGWSRYNLALIGVAWGLAAVQFLSVWRRPLPLDKITLDPAAWSKQLGYWLPGGLFFGAAAPHWLGKAFFVISPALLALLGWALWRGERKRLWTVLALLGGGGMVYAGGIRLQGAYLLTGLRPFEAGGRYFYAFYLAAVWTGILYYHDSHPRLRRASVGALAMMLLASASHFVSEAKPNLHWERYAPPLDAGREMKDIPILPDWKIDVPGRK